MSKQELEQAKICLILKYGSIENAYLIKINNTANIQYTQAERRVLNEHENMRWQRLRELYDSSSKRS